MKPISTASARILVIDDEQANVDLLKEFLGAHFAEVKTVTDPRHALPVFIRFSPDIILLDINMPYIGGLELLQQLRPHLDEDGYLPVVVLTASTSISTRRTALGLGAMDFVAKPFDLGEVLQRVSNLLQNRFLHRELSGENLSLEDAVRERTDELEMAQEEILHRLALVTEYRDDATGQHTRRVGDLSAFIAREMSLPAETVEMIRLAAPLHDLGKSGIPDRILYWKGKLSPDGFEEIKLHTTIGAEILAGGKSELMRTAECIALNHHERWDGKGYPCGLAGETIPIVARIVAAADTFDALTHIRPYRQAWSVPEAVAEIRRESGGQFDPDVVDALVRVLVRNGAVMEAQAYGDTAVVASAHPSRVARPVA